MTCKDCKVGLVVELRGWIPEEPVLQGCTIPTSYCFPCLVKRLQRALEGTSD